MKTLKFALIAVLVACTMVSLANTDGFKSKPKKAINMTYDRAVKIPGLVMAMRQQLDDEFLKKIEYLYVVEVDYNGALYRILGSRQSWLNFFKPKPIVPILFKSEGGGIH